MPHQVHRYTADMRDAIVRGYADTAEGAMHFRRVVGSEPPIVLLHRTPASSASFDAMLCRMAGRRAAIALDTPGFGESFRPPGMPDTIAYARWFLEALDTLGIDDFHLCAHHTATHFAAEMAVLAPNRVRSLALSGVIYADAADRARMLTEIGKAKAVDPDGTHLAAVWDLMRWLVVPFDADLAHSETLGALAAIEGRDQAFGAILTQDFAAVLARVTAPVAIIQACDDPLMPMLSRVRAAHPAIPVRQIGSAYLYAPERQPNAFADAALEFAADPNTFEGSPMTDRRFELVRTATGFDLAETRAPTPEPGPGEVLLRVRAASINRRDVMIRELTYPVPEGADLFIPMSDAAGEIVAVGAGVTAWKPGERVCSTFFQNWESGRITFPAVISALGAGGRGVLADHVVLSETGVAPVPDDWSFEEAACLPCAGVTAWSALKVFGQLQKDDWVLVIGTGGVAIFALQIAVAAGAKVAILSSSDAKLQRARALGASVTINYRDTPAWAEAVKAATGGGVQHVVELGGDGTLAQSTASLAIGGHLALVGALAGFGGNLSGTAMVMAALRASAVVCGSQADHAALTNFMVANGIRPVIDSVLTFDQAERAYARADAGAFGKVVISF